MTKTNPRANAPAKVEEPDEMRPNILILEGLSGASECVYQAGGEPWSLSPYKHNAETIKAAMESGFVEGLLLTGGGDVDPRRYGQTASKEVYGVSEDRDVIEFYALDMAFKAGIPVMGICRGSQVMNVHAGGTLWQHVPAHYGKEALRHKSGTIRVTTRRKSRARLAMGNNVATVHLHHQSVRKVGKGYRPAAWSPTEGVIEAIESVPGEPWRIGVQFHPEMSAPDEAERGLFRHLVLEAAKIAGLEEPTARPSRIRPHFGVSGVGTTGKGWTSSRWDDEWDEDNWPTVVGTRSQVADANVKYRDGVEEVSFTVNGEPVDEVEPDSQFAELVCPVCLTEFDFHDDYFDHLSFVHEIAPNGKAVVFANASKTEE